MIHCGSRGLGHQIGTEFLKEMAIAGQILTHLVREVFAEIVPKARRHGAGRRDEPAPGDENVERPQSGG